MMLLKNFQIFRLIFRERYREPTIEIVFPFMMASNIFLPAFSERGFFQTYAIVLALFPIISVSETIAFALGLRNIIFVTGNHIYRGSIIPFFMLPIKRSAIFFMMYFSDVVFPYILWLLSLEFYLIISGIYVPSIIIITFTCGYFFIENIIYLISLTFKSEGISTLLSIFTSGIIFIFGGILNYELIISNSSLLLLSSFSNPFIILLAQYEENKDMLIFLLSGLLTESVISTFALLYSYIRFVRLEI